MAAIAASPAPSVSHARSATVARHVLRLIVRCALTFFGLTVITFCIGRVVPIDPVLAVVGDRAPTDVYDRVCKEMGLDQPLYEQFWLYVAKTCARRFRHLRSSRTQPVLEDLAASLSRHHRTGHHRDPDRRPLRRAHGRARRGQAGPLARPGHARRRADRLFDAGVLARPRGLAACSTASSAGSPDPGRIDVFYEDIVDPSPASC